MALALRSALEYYGVTVRLTSVPEAHARAAAQDAETRMFCLHQAS